jgi:Ca2+-binding EF-hand superfamily protein
MLETGGEFATRLRRDYDEARCPTLRTPLFRQAIPMVVRHLVRSIAIASLLICCALTLPAVAAKKGKSGKAQKAGFKAFDIDNDMRLSPAEYKMMAETKPKKYTHKFDQVDADHDGYISIEEYRKSFEKEKPAKGNGKGNKKSGKKKAK